MNPATASLNIVGLSELSRTLVNIANAALEGGTPNEAEFRVLEAQKETAHRAQRLFEAAPQVFINEPRPSFLVRDLLKLRGNKMPRTLDERVKIARVCTKNAYALSTLLSGWVVAADAELQKPAQAKAAQQVLSELDEIIKTRHGKGASS